MSNNPIAFLNNIANCTRNNILQSQYYNKCCYLAVKDRLNLPLKFRDYLTRCRKCLIPYTERTKYTVEPVKAVKKKTKQQLIEGRKKFNVMIMECHFCGYKMKHKMEKPAKIKETQNDQQLNTNSMKKKKKKRKDKFSGLNQDVVLAVNQKPVVLKPEFTPQKTKADLWRDKKRKEKLIKIGNILKQKKTNNMKKKLNKLSNILKSNDNKKGTKGLKDFLNVLSAK